MFTPSLNRSRYGFSLAAALLFTFASLGSKALQADTIISAQFECANCGTVATNYSGVEPDAAAADAQFQNSNIWNHLAANQSGSVSFANLVNNAGTATSAGLTISSISGGYNSAPLFGLPDTYFVSYFNSSFTISGLPPDESFTLFLYAYTGNGDATFTVGSSSFNTFGAHPSSEDPGTAVDGSITGTTSASGTISGTWDLDPTNKLEIDWSGFQLDVASPAAAIPEPSTWLLLGSGLIGCLFGAGKRKRNAV